MIHLSVPETSARITAVLLSVNKGGWIFDDLGSSGSYALVIKVDANTVQMRACVTVKERIDDGYQELETIEYTYDCLTEMTKVRQTLIDLIKSINTGEYENAHHVN